MRRLWVAMLIVGCAHEPAEPLRDPTPKKQPPTPTYAPIQPTTSRDLSTIAKSLADVEYFAVGGVGFAGSTSEGETLTLALAKESDALVMFERLLSQPNRPAQLYAYWALRTLAPDRANVHRTKLATDSTTVHTMSGCLGADFETSRVIADIDRMPAMPAP